MMGRFLRSLKVGRRTEYLSLADLVAELMVGSQMSGGSWYLRRVLDVRSGITGIGFHMQSGQLFDRQDGSFRPRHFYTNVPLNSKRLKVGM